MDALDPAACFMVGDDLFDFTLDDEDKATTKDPSFSSLESSNPDSQDFPEDHSGSFPEFVEEELEWLSNKDAFPGLDTTCLDIFLESPGVVPNALSPVSILENSSTSSCTSNSNGSSVMSCCGGIGVPVQYPVRARSKHRRRRRSGGFPELPGLQRWWWDQGNNDKKESPLPPRNNTNTVIWRRCQHCQAEKTPQWRAGPMGPKTLCNACGVRYKSGRLVPEYRPACSPTFSSALHSNSHRKVMEMIRQKQLAMARIGANEACGYRVG